MEWHSVTVLWLPYLLVKVCTDIVRLRIGLAYSNCTVATVHIGNIVPDIVTVRIRMAYSNCTVANVHIGNGVH